MQWITTDKLPNFPFWGGAEPRAKQLTYSELEELEEALEIQFKGRIPTATEINDFVCFKFPMVCAMLGLGYDEENDRVIRQPEADMSEQLESIRKEAPALAEALEAGIAACMEGAMMARYSPDVVISDEPNFQVIIAKDSMDPHPARVSVQGYDEHDAIENAVANLNEHGFTGYVETEQPEHPEDYIEVTGGWILSTLVHINKTSGIRATHVPEHLLHAIVNGDRSGLSPEDENELDGYLQDLADSGIPEAGLGPVCGPDGEFWDVDDDPRTGRAVLCSVFVGK